MPPLTLTDEERAEVVRDHETGTHVCPGGCGRKVSNRLVACAFHWRLVPRDVQQQVYRAYDRWKREMTPGSAGAHLGAVDSAVDAMRRAARERAASTF